MAKEHMREASTTLRLPTCAAALLRLAALATFVWISAAVAAARQRTAAPTPPRRSGRCMRMIASSRRRPCCSQRRADSAARRRRARSSTAACSDRRQGSRGARLRSPKRPRRTSCRWSGCFWSAALQCQQRGLSMARRRSLRRRRAGPGRGGRVAAARARRPIPTLPSGEAGRVFSPLAAAAFNGSTESAAELGMKFGADPNALDDDGSAAQNHLRRWPWLCPGCRAAASSRRRRQPPLCPRPHGVDVGGGL